MLVLFDTEFKQFVIQFSSTVQPYKLHASLVSCKKEQSIEKLQEYNRVIQSNTVTQTDTR